MFCITPMYVCKSTLNQSSDIIIVNIKSILIIISILLLVNIYEFLVMASMTNENCSSNKSILTFVTFRLVYFFN